MGYKSDNEKKVARFQFGMELALIPSTLKFEGGNKNENMEEQDVIGSAFHLGSTGFIA